jgi:DNA-binding MarR family transcriptional regulator
MKPDPREIPELVPALERATHLVGVYLERRIAPLEITQAEAHILARLHRGGGVSPNELHRLFGHKRSTLTGVIDRLEARSYVKREINPADRRSFIISLTSEGEKAAATVSDAIGELERKIASHLSSRDLSSLTALLEALETARSSVTGSRPASSIG